MKIINLMIAAVFALCAAVQYNDPDPLLWIAIYLSGAAVAVMAALDRSNVFALAALVAACIVWMTTLAGGMADYLGRGDLTVLANSMTASEPYIEESREFVGLGLICLFCILQLPAAWRGRRASGYTAR